MNELLLQMKETIGVYVLKDRNLLTVEGIMADLKLDLNNMYIGYGLEGYLIACVLSFYRRKNVAFIRNAEKQYGTCNILDGYIDLSANYTLVVPEEKEQEAYDIALNNNIKIKKIYVVKVIKRELSLNCLHVWKEGDYQTFPIQHVDMKLYLKVLRSRKGFILSSGAKSDIYLETLPAANMFKVIETAINKFKEELNEYELYVGLGFGGVFFSIIASMLMKKKFILLDMREEKTPKTFESGKVLFFDDFLSSGSNLEIANEIIQSDVEKAAIVLYSRKKDIDALKLYVCELVM